MPQLVIDNKPQSVTTILSFKDDTGMEYVVFGRPDPRHRETKTASLQNQLLPVGEAQFIGGKVEEIVPSATLARLSRTHSGFYQLPPTFDKRIAANALKEISEEISLPLSNAHALFAKARLSLVETVTRTSTHKDGEQDIHYLSLDLGTLSHQQVDYLKQTIIPADDLIQTIILPLDKLSDHMPITLKPADGHYATKTDGVTGGLEGIDLQTLDPDKPIGMFTPTDPAIRSDSTILRELLAHRLGVAPAPQKLHLPGGSTLVLATQNGGKVRELQAMLKGHAITVIGIPQLEQRMGIAAGTLGDADESGLTYQENAAIGANEIVAAIQASTLENKGQYFAISDDSGMELDGVTWKTGADKAAGENTLLAGLPFPGVHTKRFRVAQQGTEVEQNAAAFAFYDKAALPGRAIRTTTALAVKQATAPLDAPCFMYSGTLEGTLAYPPRGTMGFGYDPVFQPAGHDQTLAEMTPEEKNQLSQRKMAFESFAKEALADCTAHKKR